MARKRSRLFYGNEGWVPIYDINVASAVIDMLACMKAYSDAALVQKIQTRFLYETKRLQAGTLPVWHPKCSPTGKQAVGSRFGIVQV